MPTPIRIRVGDLVLDGELDDSATARAIAAALPIEGDLRTFGEQFYLESPVDCDLDEDPTEEVRVGDIAYWPPSLAVAFFFGPTPETPPGSDRPVPPSPVTVVGRFRDPERLRGRERERTIRVEAAPSDKSWDDAPPSDSSSGGARA